jgi:hypothetical protein
VNTIYVNVTRRKNIRLGKILKQVSFVREEKKFKIDKVFYVTPVRRFGLR